MNTLSLLDIGKIVAAYCAANDSLEAFQSWTTLCSAQDITIIDTTLQQLKALRLQRMLAKRRPLPQQQSTRSLQVEQIEDHIYLNDELVGNVVTLLKPTLPHEVQARIAYEVFYQRFFDYLAHKRFCVVLAQNDFLVELFVPSGILFEFSTIWDEAISELFGLESLRTTFIALVNAIKLTDRGFSALDVPVVTPDQAELLAAFNLTNLLLLQKGDRRREGEIARYRHDLQVAKNSKEIERLKCTSEELQNKIEEYRERYEPSYAIWRNVQHTNFEWARRVEHLAHQEFQPLAGTQISKVGSKFGKAIQQIQELAQRWTQGNYFQVPPLFLMTLESPSVREGGDNHTRSCYSCGRPLAKGEVSYQANTLIFASPSQRLQSGGSQTQPPICGICAALAFISPIKLGTGRLVLRLRNRHPLQAQSASYMLDDQLRMLALGELNVVSGRYALLQAPETIGTKLIIDSLGAVQYALYKIASLFPAAVFVDYTPEVVVGESLVPLLSRQVASMHWLNVTFELRGNWTDKGKFAAFGRAIRSVQHDNLVSAIYELLKAGQVNVNPFSRVRANQLEKLREEQIRWLTMDQEGKKADFYRDVAGMTGILYAFCDYVRSQTTGNEQRIEVRKLIERITDPYQFIYTAAATTKSEAATLYRNEDMFFSYDQAKAMLASVGIDLAKREGANQKGEPTLQIFFDDVVTTYVRLFEKKYPTTKEQRDFLYALKLSLHARFPQLIERLKENE